MDWDKLRIFHAVADAGSFTRAGEYLNLSQSAVSRQISALETSLNAALFHRHARGLILTEQGEMLYQTVREVFHKLSMVEAQLSETKDKPSGPLKITTTHAFGATWLTPRIKEFVEHFPDVRVVLLMSDGELDLGMREADVAIRMSRPRQPDLIQRNLLSVHHHVYAARDYLEEIGSPETVEDLDRHRLIVYGLDLQAPASAINYLLEVGMPAGQRRTPALIVNNLYGMLQAVRSGLGLASLPDYMVPDDSNMVRVLPDLDGPSFQCYFVYPEELRHSKRISVFRDFLLEKVAQANF